METKRCNKCGRELPVTEFYKKAGTRDGLQYTCKDCQNAYYKLYHQSRGTTNVVRKTSVSENPELSKFQPRELIEELRYRGYSGKLIITREIIV